MGAGLENLVDNGLVAVLTLESKSGIALVHLLAQVAVVGKLKQGQTAGSMECKHPFAFHAAAIGLFGCLCDARLGQARKAGRIFDYNLECVGSVEKILVECQVQVGKLGIYSLEFFFLLGIEQCAVANEALIVVFYSSLRSDSRLSRLS